MSAANCTCAKMLTPPTIPTAGTNNINEEPAAAPAETIATDPVAINIPSGLGTGLPAALDEKLGDGPTDSESKQHCTHERGNCNCNNDDHSSDNAFTIQEFDAGKETVIDHCQRLLSRFDQEAKIRIIRQVIINLIRDKKMTLEDLRSLDEHAGDEH